MKNKNSAKLAQESMRIAANLCMFLWNVDSYSSEGSQIIPLVFQLARNGKKEKALEKAAASFVLLMEKAGCLTPVAPGRKFKKPYGNWRTLEKYYVEDEKSADAFTVPHEYGTGMVNVSRVAAYGFVGILHVLAAAFFGSKLPAKIASNQYDQSGPSDKIFEKIEGISRSYDDVAFLKDTMHLSEDEATFLQATYTLSRKPLLYRFIHAAFGDFDENDARTTVICNMCGFDERRVKYYLRTGEKIFDYGLVNLDGKLDKDVAQTIAEGNVDAYFSDLLKRQNVNDAFELDSFEVDERAKDNLRYFLKGDNEVNLLLYGKPGSGKTEFAKALAKACGLEAFVYKNETEMDGKNDDSSERHSIARLNCILSLERKNSVIIVDEAETVLRTRSLFGCLAQKGAINQMLDKNVNKVIWILNYTDDLDESTKRRMTYSVKFDGMSEKSMKRIAKSELDKIQMPETLRKKVLALFGKYKVTGASVKNATKTLSAISTQTMDKKQERETVALVEDILKANAALVYGRPNPKMRQEVCDSYCESVLNTSIPADRIVQMVKNAVAFDKKNKNKKTGIRILLYGLSGAGKTEFVRYIGQCLNKKVILKRASDILGMYVGESEKNIRDAFNAAKCNDTILFFDEADSFFADRSNAQRSWERTQVNEFLTQMEEFGGICICATNLKDIMDPAMQRRFHLAVEFKPLKEEGVKTLLQKYFGKYDFTPEQIDSIMRYNSVTPGDFSVLFSRVRFMDGEKVNADFIANELQTIQKEKSYFVNGKVVGFCA